MEYPEYSWIQDSLDTLRDENEQVRALIKELEKKEKPSKYYFFPDHLVKIPTETIFVELNDYDMLECIISEN